MIRRARIFDAQPICDLHCASIVAGCRGHYSIVELVQWAASLRPSAYVRLMTCAEVQVFEEGGDLLGFAVSSPDLGLMNAIYVRPESQRRGVGRELVGAMEEVARGRGARELRLDATLNAVPFYEALGYTSRGPSVNRLPSGAELPCVAMGKALRER